jgi:hypothetical protein
MGTMLLVPLLRQQQQSGNPSEGMLQHILGKLTIRQAADRVKYFFL